ncbi:MAG: DUF5106 domain-containing protein [Lewinellaceae bacterium]|nr:DUF5106 domain-containing protein [Saprospiraceae bacterium]MCB9342469.1 DUF5106 domain-containing protein [Lewinellaceae bacterium]
MKNLFALWAILIWGTCLSAQNLRITFQIQNLSDPTAIIGYYMGGKAFFLDSIPYQPGARQYVLEKKVVKPGVYFFSKGSERLFDFIVSGTEPDFQIEADAGNLDSLWSPDSPQNEALFRFEQARSQIEKAFEAKRTMLDMVAQATKNDEEAMKPIRADLDSLIMETEVLAIKYITMNPEHLYAKMLKSVRAPEPPASIVPSLKNGSPNPAFSIWQRTHYWDNTDFNNEILLRNTYWHLFFDNFFSQFVAVQPDSLINAIDEVIAKTPPGGDFYRFIVLRIAQYYELNTAPGADRIFVHMVDKYMRKDRTPWLDMATLERLAYKADSHRPNITGSMAVNFILPDENGNPVELYEIKAPITLLIFYSPLCSHCMEVMPNIYQAFLDYQVKGLAAVALNTDEESAYWKKFVAQQNWIWYDVDDRNKMPEIENQYNAFNLPVIYILDKDKRILAKRVAPGALGDMLADFYAKMK